MCSNRNNNRRHPIGHYVVEVDGVMVDRRRVADPVLRAAGLPKPTIPAEQPTKAAAPLPLAGAALPAEADAIALAAIAPAPVANEPRTYLAIPAFDATATIAAQRRAALGMAARANREAIKADRASRKKQFKQVRKLRSHKAAREAAAALPVLPVVARSDVEGLTAAKQLTAQLAPRQLFNQESLMNKCRQYGNNPRAHELVKANIWRNSTMMASVDLRDNEVASYDGKPVRRGAIYEPETALNCTKVNLQFWVEMAGCAGRAIDEFRRVAEYCPRLQSLRVEVIGESNHQAAREVAQALLADFESGESGFSRRLAVEWDASEYHD